jgi:hypothetical protein
MSRRAFVPLAAGLLLVTACPAATPDCAADAVDCGGACVRLQSDDANCGACGVACGAGTVCSAGSCEVACATGLVNCGGSCIDPLTDMTFCGADAACAGGVACTAGQTCVTGVCTSSSTCATELVCYQGPPETHGVGTCASGCTAADSGVCVGQVLPAIETCDGLDNDCDGAADELLVRSCYEGAPATVDPVTGLPHGTCKTGVQACSAGAWSVCTGQVLPAPEDCGLDGLGNGVDEDCDGTADDGCGCTPDGYSLPCYDGPAGTSGVGECRSGVRTCTAGSWTSCAGQAVPVAEICANGLDDDCDGAIDDVDVCGCAEGTSLLCYEGPTGTADVGTCHAGLRICAGGSWGSCVGQAVPVPEICANGLDDDCDGTIDDADVCGV